MSYNWILVWHGVMNYDFGMTYDDGVWGWIFFILVFAPCSPGSPWCSPRVFQIAPFKKIKIPYPLPKILPLLTYMGAKGEALYCYKKIAILGSLPKFQFFMVVMGQSKWPIASKKKKKKKERRKNNQTNLGGNPSNEEERSE